MKARSMYVIVFLLVTVLAVQPIAAQSCTPGVTFVDDVTVPDDTVYQPGTPFEKIWKLQNSGTCDWTDAYTVVFVGGDILNATSPQQLGRTIIGGETMDLGIVMRAPDSEGTYTSRWQMHDDAGAAFGDPFYVRIQVLQTQEAQASIASPATGTTVGGQVEVTGSAVHPAFDYYKLEYGPGEAPADSQMTVAGDLMRDQQLSGLLGVWDTTELDDGLYSLRLRVVDRDGNYKESWVRNLTVDNAAPAPEPTVAAVQPEPAATATEVPPTATSTTAPPTEAPAAAPDEFQIDVVAVMTAVAGGDEAQSLLNALASKHFPGAEPPAALPTSTPIPTLMPTLAPLPADTPTAEVTDMGFTSEVQPPTEGQVVPTVEAVGEAQAGLQVTSFSSYTDTYGYMYVVGEVVNVGGVPLKDVSLATTLKDGAGNELGVEDYNRISLDIVPAGGKYPFNFSIDEELQGWEELDFQMESEEYEAGEGYYTPHDGLSIANVVEHETESEYDDFTLTGNVVNSRDVPAGSVRLAVTAYDEAGQVVDTNGGYPYLDLVPANGSVPFELRLEALKEAPSGYEIQVQGREDEDRAEEQRQVPLEVASYTTYVDGWDSLRIVGEAENAGGVTAKGVDMSAALLDQPGGVLAVSSTNWDGLELVEPGGKYPFGFSFSEGFEGWTDVELQVQAYPYDEERSYFTPHRDLRVQGVTGSEPESDWSGYKLAGEVVNDGSVAAESIKVVVVAYDEMGAVVDVNNAIPQLEDGGLAPGAGAPFELELRGLKEAPPTYEALVQGREVEAEEGATATDVQPTTAPLQAPTSTAVPPTTAPLQAPTSTLPSDVPEETAESEVGGFGFTTEESGDQPEPSASTVPSTITPMPTETPGGTSSGFGFTTE